MNDTGVLGFPSMWYNYFPGGVMPDDYKFPSAKFGMRLYRKQIRRDVDTAMPITPNNPIVRWKIPSSGTSVLDFRRGCIYVTLSVQASAVGANPSPSNLAWNIVDRFRIEQGGNVVIDQRYFNLQETLMYTMLTQIEQRETTANNLWGAGSRHLRKTRANGFKYCIPLPSNCITKTMLPWFVMQRADTRNMGSWVTTAFQDVYFQWEFAKPEAFVETDIASPVSWTISRIEVEYEEIFLTNLSDFMSNWHTFSTKYPKLPFKSLSSFITNLQTAEEQDILLDIKVSSLISIFCTFRFTDTINTPTLLDKFENYLGRATLPLIEFQWQINGIWWPEKPVNCTDSSWVEPYKLFLQTTGKYHGRGLMENSTPILPGEFIDDKFVLCFDATQHPFHPSLLNPVSTSSGNTPVHLRLKFSAPIAANIQMVVHTYHWKIWNIGSKGDISLSEV